MCDHVKDATVQSIMGLISWFNRMIANFLTWYEASLQTTWKMSHKMFCVIFVSHFSKSFRLEMPHNKTLMFVSWTQQGDSQGLQYYTKWHCLITAKNTDYAIISLTCNSRFSISYADVEGNLQYSLFHADAGLLRIAGLVAVRCRGVDKNTSVFKTIPLSVIELLNDWRE